MISAKFEFFISVISITNKRVMSDEEHTMTPDELFDELDKVFGCDDGYVNHLQRIKDLRNFKSAVTRKLFDDLDLFPKSQLHNDRDLLWCIEGLRNLQTGFDEYDPEDGEYVKHHPSYNELKDEKERVEKENKELKENFQVVWEVLGESSYADELNKRLFPENFEED